MEKISVKEWIVRFQNNEYESVDVRTQIKSGWYDWFCKDSTLKNKTYKMGRIIEKVKAGGKVDLDNWYVWFKNNCPLNGPLYDDFRFADRKTGNVQFTIQINCCWNKSRYAVYGRTPDGMGHWEEPLFECNDSRILVNWLNSPWEE